MTIETVTALSSHSFSRGAPSADNMPGFECADVTYRNGVRRFIFFPVDMPALDFMCLAQWLETRIGTTTDGARVKTLEVER